MPTIHFASLPDAEIVSAEFEKLDGSIIARHLPVDTGFSGASGVLLSIQDADLMWAKLPFANTSGALQGQQQRGVVRVGIAGLLAPRGMAALFADLTSLSLPAGVQGMAGLSFLREFDRWGAERQSDGSWRFGLTVGTPSPAR